MNAARWSRLPDALWRRSLDAVIVLGTSSPEPVTLSATAPEVWELLATPTTFRDLVLELSRRHAGDPATVEPDVEALLARLADLGAVSSTPADAAS